jgi:hypothetical protein
LPIVDAQDLDRRRRNEDLAERMHPAGGLRTRADPTLTEVVELVESGQLNLELQRRAAMTAVSGTSNRADKPVWRAAATSRRMKSIARWRLIGSTSYENRARYMAILLVWVKPSNGWAPRPDSASA